MPRRDSSRELHRVVQVVGNGVRVLRRTVHGREEPLHPVLLVVFPARRRSAAGASIGSVTKATPPSETLRLVRSPAGAPTLCSHVVVAARREQHAMGLDDVDRIVRVERGADVEAIPRQTGGVAQPGRLPTSWRTRRASWRTARWCDPVGRPGQLALARHQAAARSRGSRRCWSRRCTTGPARALPASGRARMAARSPGRRPASPSGSAAARARPRRPASPARRARRRHSPPPAAPAANTARRSAVARARQAGPPVSSSVRRLCSTATPRTASTAASSSARAAVPIHS